MENTIAADPSVEAVDVAVTRIAANSTPTASTATTTAVTKPKVKVKKEMTAAETEFRNQKRQAWRVAQRAIKAGSVTAALEEEKRERMTRAQETMKLRELVGEAKTDALAGADSSSSVMS
jgi:hypothetical protein